MRTSSPLLGRLIPGLLPLLVATFCLCGQLQAAPLIFPGESGDLEATASFDVSGSNLLVTLANTSTADVLVPTDVLTAVFFDIAGDPTLTPVSAVLAAGSTVFFGGTDPGDVVGGEWAYASGFSGAPGGTGQGIGSAGFGLFGSGDLFPGSDLDFPPSPDGLNYGIISAGDDTTTGNTPVTGTLPLIKNAVDFTLSGLPDGFALTDISNVWFQYGTGLDEPNFPHFPEPGTLLLLGSAAVALAGCRRSLYRR